MENHLSNAAKRLVVRKITSIVLYIGLASASAGASAVPIGGVEFPAGAASFVDAVVLFEPMFGGGPVPSAGFAEPSNALGVPEAPGVTTFIDCDSMPAAACPSVSLGRGGRITLRFTDNLLTGSDSTALDLWIFEIGPDVEDTFVEISKDGIVWHDVGKVFGATAGIDIDAFGFTSADHFRFVRLRDDPAADGMTGVSVGADIDAVGAITTRVPEPGTLALILLATALLSALRRSPRFGPRAT